MFISGEYGNDIMPTIMMHYYINDKIKFDKIIKLHTKTSDDDWFNKSIDFLLDNLINLDNYFNDKCNCVGNTIFLHKYNVFNMNMELMNKYKNMIDKQYFIGGSNFYCDKNLFDIIIEIIKYDYMMFFNNNMYDTNEILYDISPVHFLERLFGIVKINKNINTDGNLQEINPHTNIITHANIITNNDLDKLIKNFVPGKNINYNFDYYFYVQFYDDNTYLNPYKALEHYNKFKKNCRIPNLGILLDLYNLKTINNAMFNELKGRKESIIDILKKKYYDFDYEFYKNLYKNDLLNINTDEDALMHYNYSGKYQNRIFNRKQLIEHTLKINKIIENDIVEQKNLFSKNKNKFSILVRTNKRPTCFQNIYNSIYSQKYDNKFINFIVSYHNDITYNYLKNYDNIQLVKVEETKIVKNQKNPYPYNLYLNDLINKVSVDSWIIFIDDDDLFINNIVLQTINYEIEKIKNITKNNNFALFWRVKRCDQLLGDICYNTSNLNLQILPLCGFTIHSNNVNILKFNTNRVAMQINKLKNKLPIYWSKYILTKIGQNEQIAGFGFVEI
jgi:hypothetical protein